MHSGDSISVYPPFSISDRVKGIILQYAKKLGLGIGIVGLYNIQFIVDKDDNVFIIEVNPRSSRTVPFLSKATGYSLADIATEVILGKSLKELGLFDIYIRHNALYCSVVQSFCPHQNQLPVCSCHGRKNTGIFLPSAVCKEFMKVARRSIQVMNFS